MYAWEAIQKTLDYIEEHYGDEISVDVLAAKAHLSKYYYQRLFHRLVRKNVNEYLKLRRLAKSAEKLGIGAARFSTWPWSVGLQATAA